MTLACPLDGSVLHKSANVWRCEAGHSFDIARQGYANLLPVQHKRSADPGDSKTMVAARQRFLAAGHYQPVADAACRLVLQNSTAALPLSCLDAGCGEGYYLRALAEATRGRQRLALMGLDISKWAVLAAAKQEKCATWVVGSNANLPVQTSTLDRLLCMFGFPVYHEFARVLKPGGLLLKVDAGSNHLRELREIIYPTLKPDRIEEAPVPDGFTHFSSETVRYSLRLNDRQQIADLLAMTPHLYRANAEGREKLAARESLTVSVDVRLTCLVRSPC
ncbi:putative RNA methyltransferase [Halomonas halocynthiae]|uniref:putative RNA methyltransferase n=1 Tax=Halomonas halocynthiae TaxID=176290 RepID=UPI00054E2E29|nr:methyltransferase domain-containing protein [Halomonas halocynthiae]